MTKNTKLLKQWVRALRSGKYKQCKARLRTIEPNGDKSFCCLGVLADVSKKPIETNAGLIFDTMSLKDVTGVSINQQVLTQMNDRDDITFPEIADYIESTYIEDSGKTT
jgi:hypothetical protein